MRFLEFPGTRTYHYVKEEGQPQPWCTNFPKYGPPYDAWIVEERSYGRRLCGLCWQTASRIAKRYSLKLPPRTDWEHANPREEER